MSAETTIDRVLNSNLLVKGLVMLPRCGATPALIQAEESALGRSLSISYRDFLKRWNGLDLEVLRLFGCKTGATDPLSQMQRDAFQDRRLICFGSDPAGFLFGEDDSGRIFSFDTDGGKFKQIANSFDDFIERLVFGPDADQFSGEDWLAELRRAGLV